MASYGHGIKFLNSVSKSCNKSYVASVYTKSLNFSTCSKFKRKELSHQHERETYLHQLECRKPSCHQKPASRGSHRKESINCFTDPISQSLNYSFKHDWCNNLPYSQISTKITSTRKYVYSIVGNDDELMCRKSRSLSAVECAILGRFESKSGICQPSRSSISCEVLPVNVSENGIIYNNVNSQIALQTSKASTYILQNDCLPRRSRSECSINTCSVQKLVPSDVNQHPNLTFNKFLANQSSVIEMKKVKSLTNIWPNFNKIESAHTNQVRNYSQFITPCSEEVNRITTDSAAESNSKRKTTDNQSPTDRWVKCKQASMMDKLNVHIQDKNEAFNLREIPSFSMNVENSDINIGYNTVKPLVNTIAYSKVMLRRMNSLTTPEVKFPHNINQKNEVDAQIRSNNVTTSVCTNKQHQGEFGKTMDVGNLNQSYLSTQLDKFNIKKKQTKSTDLKHSNATVSIEIKTKERTSGSTLWNSLPKKDNFKKSLSNATINNFKKKSSAVMDKIKIDSTTTFRKLFDIYQSNKRPENFNLSKIPVKFSNVDTREKKSSTSKKFFYNNDLIKSNKICGKEKVDISSSENPTRYTPVMKIDKIYYVNALPNNVKHVHDFLKNLTHETQNKQSEELLSKNSLAHQFQNRRTVIEKNDQNISNVKQTNVEQPIQYSFNSIDYKNTNTPLRRASITKIKERIQSVNDLRDKNQGRLKVKVKKTWSAPNIKYHDIQKKILERHTTPESVLKTDTENAMPELFNDNKLTPSIKKITEDLKMRLNPKSKFAKYYTYFVEKSKGNNFDYSNTHRNENEFFINKNTPQEVVPTSKLVSLEETKKPASYKQYLENAKKKLSKKRSVTNMNALDRSQYTSANDKSYIQYFVNEYNKSLSDREQSNSYSMKDSNINYYRKTNDIIPTPVNQLEQSNFTKKLKNGEVNDAQNKIIHHFTRKLVHKSINGEDTNSFASTKNYDDPPHTNYMNTLKRDDSKKNKRYYEKYSKVESSTDDISYNVHHNSLKSQTFKQIYVMEPPPYAINVSNIDLNLPRLPNHRFYEE